MYILNDMCCTSHFKSFRQMHTFNCKYQLKTIWIIWMFRLEYFDLCNRIKSLLLSHHHSTCALVSEILESVLQTVQKLFTYRQYILTDLYRWQCAEYTYIYSVHTVYYLRHNYSYQYTLCTVCKHFTLCTHNMRRSSRFYIGRIRNVMDVRCMINENKMCFKISLKYKTS